MVKNPKPRKSRKTRSTRKVQVGYETYMNTETGELVEMPKFVIKGGDINFEKVWIWHLCEAYELVGNKAIYVLNYFFQNRDQNNLVIGSQRKIADALGVSPTTVASITAKLKANNILSMPQQGVYRINPEVMWKGSHHSRMQILYEYRSEKSAEGPLSLEEQKVEIVNELSILGKRFNTLQRRLEKLERSQNDSQEEEPKNSPIPCASSPCAE